MYKFICSMKAYRELPFYFFLFLTSSLCLFSKNIDSVKVEFGPQAKFIEGMGLSVEFNISKDINLHLSGGWLVLTTDFAIGSGMRLLRNIDAFLRFHRLEVILFPFLGVEGGSPVRYLVEPGFRFRLLRWFWFEVGALLWVDKEEHTNDRGEKTTSKALKVFPNVGLVIPILKF